LKFLKQKFFVALLAKLVGLVIWIITFIDFYSSAPLGLRYFLCFIPNAGLLFCIQVMLQYDRHASKLIKSYKEVNKRFLFIVSTASYGQLYSNIFYYELYIGLCLLLMLIYSVIYFFLAIYVERLYPGEFGVPQPWNYLFKKSYRKSSTVGIADIDHDLNKISNGIRKRTSWIELDQVNTKRTPAMKINHLNKVEKYSL
jgi:hypothetical protein